MTIILNNFLHSSTGVIRTDISDHFPNFILNQENTITENEAISTFYKRSFDDDSIINFRNSLMSANWELVTQTTETNHAYDTFLEIFSRSYNKSFPKKKVSIKTKTLNNKWMTKGLLKSSKRKQKLYERFLKHKTYRNEKIYKTYKNIFEKIKKLSKKLYYSNLLNESLSNSKKTWDTMKEIIGKRKTSSNKLPSQLNYKNEQLSEKSKIAESFNDFFASVGSDLASTIPPSSKNFESYLDKCEVSMPTKDLEIEELQLAYKSLLPNKSPGLDEISINIVRSVYDIIEPVLFYIFNLSILEGKFPNSLKIAKVTPVFKSGESSEAGNYRPISVLSCFSKVLERVMYNRLYSHLLDHELLYNKQFGFQKGHSTDHAIVQLVSEISDTFDKNMYTLGVFIDLSKTFDTVNHEILLLKLKNYGILGKNLDWFRDYLTGRKQCVSYDSKTTTAKRVTCGVPQGSILGPLLFLIYINDLYKASSILNFILFADDTNLFFSHTNIKTLYSTVNRELKLISEWFIANKLSLNAKKTKHILFHKRSNADNLPLILPSLTINNTNIKRESSMSFLGVILDKTLNWKKHIITIENKISKNIGILYKAKQFLNLACLKQLYFSFINSYLNYCNIVWGSTNITNLKKLYSKQKSACRIIFGEGRHTSVRHRLREIGALDIYQMNVYQVLIFTFKVKNGTNPSIFKHQFTQFDHSYSTRHSKHSYKIPKALLKAKRFSILYRGPILWNTVLNKSLKAPRSFSSFKRLLKQFLTEFNANDKTVL